MSDFERLVLTTERLIKLMKRTKQACEQSTFLCLIFSTNCGLYKLFQVFGNRHNANVEECGERGICIEWYNQGQTRV